MPKGVYIRTKPAPNKGRSFSKEWKQKLSEAKMGKSLPHSEEWNRRIGDAQPTSCPIGTEHIQLDIREGNLRVYIKTPDGWMRRSRYVMEQILGRKLES
jgi:hypothetical protein